MEAGLGRREVLEACLGCRKIVDGDLGCTKVLMDKHLEQRSCLDERLREMKVSNKGPDWIKVLDESFGRTEVLVDEPLDRTSGS